MADRDAATDALTLLHHQHLEVEQLFSAIERLQPVAQGSAESYLHQRRQLTEQVVHQLMTHSGIEEEHFYPALRQYVDDGDPLVDRALEQHAKAEEVAHLVDGISPDNIDYDGNIRELIHAVREHVRMEESEIFPRIQEALSNEQLLDLGAKLQKAMKHAPTRPHPHTPPASSGMGKLLARGAAVFDRMRDTASGRHTGNG